MHSFLRHFLTEQKEEEIRIVLVGRTGAGKSATGNTIIGEDVFVSKLCAANVTSKCQKAKTHSYDQTVSVVDTPGLFDTQLPKEEVVTEIAKCISLAAPGPHVFLIVIRVDRFSEEEQNTVKHIQALFGEEAACYTMVLFTRGDELEANNVSIENFISENAALSIFIRECDSRYHVFNNRKKNDIFQVPELLRKIKSMVQENKGRFYTTEMFQEAEKSIQEEVERLQRTQPGMNIEEARSQAERDNSFIQGIVATALAVLGSAVGASIEMKVGAVIGGVVAGPVGAAVGAATGFALGGVAVTIQKKIKKGVCAIQ